MGAGDLIAFTDEGGTMAIEGYPSHWADAPPVPEPPPARCAKCHGTGAVLAGFGEYTFLCNACRGTGRPHVECRQCGGGGHSLSQAQSCAVCAGMGRVPT